MSTEKNDKEAAKKHSRRKKIIIAASILAVLGLMFFFIRTGDNADNLQTSLGRSGRRHHRQKTAREYEVKFIDSLDVKNVRVHSAGGNRHWAGGGAPNPNAEASNEHPAVSGRLNAAYRLGMAFASLSDDAEAQRERLLGMVVPSIGKKADTTSVEHFFYDCVAQAENDDERGLAALMMSGYYFGSLCTVLEYIDSETQLPDEKTLAAGIRKMDNLKEYLNEALTAEKEVKTTMAIQRLEAAADSVKNAYYNCQADYDEEGNKYDALLSTIKGIEDVLK